MAYKLVRKADLLIKAKHKTANVKLNSIFRQRANFAAGQWVWVYDDKSTISGGGKHVLKAPADGSSRKSFALVSKLAHCWTESYKVLVVDPKNDLPISRQGGSWLLKSRSSGESSPLGWTIGSPRIPSQRWSTSAK